MSSDQISQPSEQPVSGGKQWQTPTIVRFPAADAELGSQPVTLPDDADFKS